MKIYNVAYNSAKHLPCNGGALGRTHYKSLANQRSGTLPIRVDITKIVTNESLKQHNNNYNKQLWSEVVVK